MNLREQSNIFNIFHDGFLSKCEEVNDNIRLTIEIPYLAELINPSYENFNVLLVGCSKFLFNRWEENNNTIQDLKEIEKLELGILTATVGNDFTNIVCEGDNFGGNIVFKAEDIVIFDETNKQITLDELRRINHSYWNSFRKD